MAELDEFLEQVKRQRRSIDDLLESTNTSSGETDRLVKRIEELRQRVARSRKDDEA
ncbi:MAG TPA: hypothetical protein VGR02_02815 [Thermoanaerobaculia bacterium]|jgi:hypothetical protein|nr:hypothetical protein [Thermoanaerobaculia bacterium]